VTVSAVDPHALAARRPGGLPCARAEARNDPPIALLDPGCFTPFYDVPLALHLRERGWRVEWITSAFEFEDVSTPPELPVRHLFFRGLHSKRLAGAKALRRVAPLRRAIKLASYPAGLARLRRMLASRPPGILHVQWAHLPVLESPLWADLRAAGWRIVYTVHDPRPLAGTTAGWLRYIQPSLVAAADAIVVHGQSSREHLLGLGADARRVHVVPPAPPLTPDGTESRERARRDLGLSSADPVVLFFGFIKPYKGLRVLLESTARLRETLPDVRLLVAGEPVGSAAPYRRAIARLGLGEHVHWTGAFVPTPTLAKYLAAADVVALPYLDGSSSGALLTAQSFGRPVVATRVADLPELVDPGETGLLVPPADAGALAAALRELLVDRDRCDRLGARGRERVATLFAWPRHAERMERLYREVWSETAVGVYRAAARGARPAATLHNARPLGSDVTPRP
jgi:glycosyltransferase involved in cell wall biosynthesis